MRLLLFVNEIVNNNEIVNVNEIVCYTQNNQIDN